MTITHDAMDLTIKHPPTWDLTAQGPLGPPLYMAHHCTGTLPHPTGTPPPPDMSKLVHYEAHTVGKWVVRILLECFLVIYYKQIS